MVPRSRLCVQSFGFIIDVRGETEEMDGDDCIGKCWKGSYIGSRLGARLDSKLLSSPNVKWLLAGSAMEWSPMKSKLMSERFGFVVDDISEGGIPSNAEFWKISSCQLIAMKSSVSIKDGSKMFESFSGSDGVISGRYDGGESCLFLFGFPRSESDDELFDAVEVLGVDVSFREDAAGFPILRDGL